MMLRNGTVAFEGPAADLRASKDPYLSQFLS
jgi:ABC-type transporter Mla maintaining outer membrane lipid asymmetry ATPase subunit MlaF